MLSDYKVPESNYRFFVTAMQNKKPERMPLYEHHIDAGFIQKDINVPMVQLLDGSTEDKKAFFKNYVDYWENHGYDIVTFERGIPLSCPGSGALRFNGEPCIKTPEDVRNYPWDKIPDWFFEQNAECFELFAEEVLKRDNIRAVGGPGYGIFETVQDLAGYMELCYLMYDEPEMVDELFANVRNLYAKIWSRFLKDYAEPFCVCRMGDDLGFRDETLLPHEFIVKQIIPGYKTVVDLVHDTGRPFILHSCGQIFGIMDEILATGIDAKHSNEDQIAPFHKWVELYGDKLCNLGGIDMNILCMEKPDTIERKVKETIEENIDFGGFGLGCGNSIPDYIPLEGFYAMNKAANEYRLQQYH